MILANKTMISTGYFIISFLYNNYLCLLKLNVFILFLWAGLIPYAFSASYPLPSNPGDSLIGDPDKQIIAIATKDDTLLDIALRYDVGQNEILLANPEIDRWMPGEGTEVIIPNSYLLPDAPREGLILNLPEFRLYYFPSNQEQSPSSVLTYPISIGRQNWETPLGITKVIEKKENPTWTPPASIKKEHAEKGEILPDVVPAGPDNPLGLFAIRLGIPGYLIHSTNKPYGVGMRVSHGCIRMYPKDIEQLFPDIPVATPVNIVNQPIKVGWLDNTLYIQVYPPLEVESLSYDDYLQKALDLIEKANNNQIPVLEGEKLTKALKERNGKPIAIFQRKLEINIKTNE
jgi:L,D-transpeptidase ErfK/SrfK